MSRKKLQPPPRKNYTKSSSESSEYEDDSESDNEDKGQGLVIDVSNKKRKMAATISKRGRRGEQTYQSQNYERVFSTMKTMMMMMMMKRKMTMTTVAHHG